MRQAAGKYAVSFTRIKSATTTYPRLISLVQLFYKERRFLWVQSLEHLNQLLIVFLILFHVKICEMLFGNRMYVYLRPLVLQFLRGKTAVDAVIITVLLIRILIGPLLRLDLELHELFN